MSEEQRWQVGLTELNFLLALAQRAPKYPFEEILLQAIIERLKATPLVSQTQGAGTS